MADSSAAAVVSLLEGNTLSDDGFPEYHSPTVSDEEDESELLDIPTSDIELNESQVTTASIRSTRDRRRTGWIWNHQRNEDRDYISYSKKDGRKTWECSQCAKSYAAGGGTRIIMRHLKEKHNISELSPVKLWPPVYKRLLTLLWLGGWVKVDKYYALTDVTPVYLASMVLDPTMKWDYFDNCWDDHPDWIAKGKLVVEEFWDVQYKDVYTAPAAPIAEDDELSETENLYILHMRGKTQHTRVIADELALYLSTPALRKVKDKRLWWLEL